MVTDSGSSGTTAEELIGIAERREQEGNIIEALAQWRAVLDLETDAVSLCRFGRVAMKADRFEEARQAFLAALELDPELPRIKGVKRRR